MNPSRIEKAIDEIYDYVESCKPTKLYPNKVMVEKGELFDLLDELRGQEKTYLLVAHNGIARAVRSYFYDMTNEQYASYGIRNCELVSYAFETERKNENVK